MEFFIRQNSTGPDLRLKLIDDAINDKSYMNQALEYSIITIDMFDVITGKYQILKGRCYAINNTKTKYNSFVDEFFIVYTFSEGDTAVKGRYEAIITIKTYRSTYAEPPLETLIVPIREKLYINVI